MERDDLRQDIIDSYAVELCQDDVHYLYHGTCTAMEKIEQTNAWKPTTADGTAAGSTGCRSTGRNTAR